MQENKAMIMSIHDANLAEQFCTHALLLFADGKHLQGPIETIFTNENLSELYQHPLKKINVGENVFWQAANLHSFPKTALHKKGAI